MSQEAPPVRKNARGSITKQVKQVMYIFQIVALVSYLQVESQLTRQVRLKSLEMTISGEHLKVIIHIQQLCFWQSYMIQGGSQLEQVF